MRRLTVALVLLLTPIMLAANRVHPSVNISPVQSELHKALASLDREISRTALTKTVLVKSGPYYQCLSLYEDELSSLKSAIHQNYFSYDYTLAHKLNQTFSHVRSSC